MSSQEFVAARLEEAIEQIQSHVNNIRNSIWTTFYGFERDRFVVDNKAELVDLCHEEVAKQAVTDFCFVTNLGSHSGSSPHVLCTSQKAAAMIAEDTGVKVRIYSTKLIDTEEFLRS